MNVRDWTVCLIEPNKFERQIIVDLLKNAGVDKIKAFADAEAATEVLELYNANIVICAFELAPVDGATWTRGFRRNAKVANRKAAVFITSGAFSRAMAEECRHAGCNALIGKPLSAKVLTATINKVLTQPRPFIDAAGYVGPCRRAGIVTAGAPKKRRKADDSLSPSAPSGTLRAAADALAVAAARFAPDVQSVQACEAALRQVQAYAVNAGDGPLMRACAVFALQISSAKSLQPDAARAAVDACAAGVVRLAALPVERTHERDAIAEGVREAVAKAAMQRAA
ncbi:MAG: two-component system response regulator [Hyphomonadaceae bacterium]